MVIKPLERLKRFLIVGLFMVLTISTNVLVIFSFLAILTYFITPFPKIRESVLMQVSLGIVCTVVMIGVYTINRSVDKAMRSFVKKLTSRK